MLYKDVIKKILSRKQMTQVDLAKQMEMPQSSLAARLSDSHNPGMKTTQDMLDLLGYELAILPKGTVEGSPSLSEVGFVPEYPEKREKFSEK